MYVRHEVNMQLAVVFYHSPCCKFLHQVFFILSCIECIHVSWCTTVRNKSIIMIIIITKVLSERRLLENVQEWWEKNSTVILRAVRFHAGQRDN